MKWAVLFGFLCSLWGIATFVFLLIAIVTDSGRYAATALLSAIMTMTCVGAMTFILTNEIDKE